MNHCMPHTAVALIDTLLKAHASNTFNTHAGRAKIYFVNLHWVLIRKMKEKNVPQVRQVVVSERSTGQLSNTCRRGNLVQSISTFAFCTFKWQERSLRFDARRVVMELNLLLKDLKLRDRQSFTVFQVAPDSGLMLKFSGFFPQLLAEAFQNFSLCFILMQHGKL